MSHKNALVMYAKKPSPGKVKTRLTQGLNPLTSQEASDFYQVILTDLIRLLSATNSYDFFICPQGDADEFRMAFRWPYRTIRDDGDGDLGHSLYRSFQQLHEMGYRYILIIGSDVPFLNPEKINNAFTCLANKSSFILGPDQQGGCYLIGGDKPYFIFHDIFWSQGKDFQILLNRSKDLGLTTKVLSKEMDIDTTEDFKKLGQVLLATETRFQKSLPSLTDFFQMFHVKHPLYFDPQAND
ncbi:MAG: hypothetical protein IEMM0008_1920 [bacterium]|nr:MAG: hypothetical protein IEMM0008_1920 [bacterium]